MSGKKVMVEVVEGTRAWAMAMVQAGKKVACDAGPCHPESPIGRSEQRGWTLYVEPPKPIEAQPGTFPWAMVHILEGRPVARAWWDGSRISTVGHINSLTSCDIRATDWVVVDA